MISDFDFFVGASVGAIAAILFIFTIKGQQVPAYELYERGYMVECIGKAGYYWECEQ